MTIDTARLFHLNVNCSDLDRARRFYVDGIGLTVGVRTTVDEVQPGTAFGLDRARWDAWILLGTAGYEGGAIDLLEWKEPLPTGAPPAQLIETGFQRFGITVPDLDATVTRLRALDGDVWGEPHTTELANGTAVRLVMACDPDGSVIELIEGDGPRVSFVAVCSADLERTAACYRALGLREATRFTIEHDDGARLRLTGPVTMHEVVFTAPGGGEVFVIAAGFEAPPARRSPPRPLNALGLGRMAFLVTDLDAATAALHVEADVELVSEPVTMAMGPGLPDLRFVCARGPDGEVLEYIEQPN